MYQCTSVPLYRCTGVPVYWRTDVLVYQCLGVPMYRCTGVSVYLCIGVMVYRRMGVRVIRSSMRALKHAIAHARPQICAPDAQVYQCTSVPVYRRTGVPVHCHTGVPAHRCISVLVYRCVGVQVCRRILVLACWCIQENALPRMCIRTAEGVVQMHMRGSVLFRMLSGRLESIARALCEKKHLRACASACTFRPPRGYPFPPI